MIQDVRKVLARAADLGEELTEAERANLIAQLDKLLAKRVN